MEGDCSDMQTTRRDMQTTCRDMQGACTGAARRRGLRPALVFRAPQGVGGGRLGRLPNGMCAIS
jgi:hypothetical protein